jgi:hypothetical protein
MSNTSQRLKDALREYLAVVRPSDDIAVVDALQRAEIELPTLAVAVSSEEPHSVVMPHIKRCAVEMTLRCHAGDDDTEINEWLDQLESALNDPSAIKSACSTDLRMDYWIYNGCEQTWDESMFEASFSAECLVVRI